MSDDIGDVGDFEDPSIPENVRQLLRDHCWAYLSELGGDLDAEAMDAMSLMEDVAGITEAFMSEYNLGEQYEEEVSEYLEEALEDLTNADEDE
jgi:hypothetical protein